MGMTFCAVTMFGAIKLDLFGLEKSHKPDKVEQPTNGALKMDGPSGFPGAGASVIRVDGQDGANEVPTGASAVPQFPTTIRLPKDMNTAAMKPGDEPISEDGEEEYELMGLGIRTVSFLRIQVYVVGMYIARSDISNLQQRLVRMAVNPPGEQSMLTEVTGSTGATSLVPAERQQLKEMLLDPERSDLAWSYLLKGDGVRTAFRIVPTRNTDFMHLRDGWVRGITARAQKAVPKDGDAGEFQDESFGNALNDFKAVFGGGHRKSVAKGQTLILLRNSKGVLDAILEPNDKKPVQWMGRVSDERVSRLVWLNYLAGKNVSSEGARSSVADGIMGIVERPVGTVVQKIV